VSLGGPGEGAAREPVGDEETLDDPQNLLERLQRAGALDGGGGAEQGPGDEPAADAGGSGGAAASGVAEDDVTVISDEETITRLRLSQGDDGAGAGGGPATADEYTIVGWHREDEVDETTVVRGRLGGSRTQDFEAELPPAVPESRLWRWLAAAAVVVAAAGVGAWAVTRDTEPAESAVAVAKAQTDDADSAATTAASAPTTEAAEPEPAVEDDEMTVGEAAVMSAAEITAAFVLSGPVGDLGWDWAHDQGRQYAEDQTGATTLFVESVFDFDGEFFKEVAVDFIENEGADIIFGTSFSYMDPMLELAAEYPDVVFEHALGYKMNDTNFGNFDGRMYQPHYLSGMAAGAMTESGLIGYVAAFPIPAVIRGINAFTLGVHEINPNAEVYVNWTFTGFDPAIEGDTASALLEAGADVIAMQQDSTAAGVAAQDAGARWVASTRDMRDSAPDAFITAPVWNWGPRYAEIIEAVAAGTYTPGAYWGGMDDGIVDLAPLADDVPGEVADRIGEVAELIRTGAWDVFTGPINDQDGAERVAAGETMEDGPMLGMDWFVEGVVGDASP